ncbi:hypothetical protein [Bradyrhizobium sp.]|uniref:hypothetical protein n=1 Tax=Bradyrhizobium sp. TaxID=376 RepID=UPI003C55D586
MPDVMMPDVMEAVGGEPAPAMFAPDMPALSDDECLERLKRAVYERDAGHLDEVARLIGRLAVTIE